MSTGGGSEGDEGAGVVNGLYVFEIEMRDGKRGEARGVVVLCDGRIMGGDSYFYYTGSYSFRGGKWRGDMTVNQHTEAVGKPLAFGGREVTCGFSGDYFSGGAQVEGMALVGKTSVSFVARLTLKDAM
jgi:T3SS negative regulator,GrlR